MFDFYSSQKLTFIFICQLYYILYIHYVSTTCHQKALTSLPVPIIYPISSINLRKSFLEISALPLPFLTARLIRFSTSMALVLNV